MVLIIIQILVRLTEEEITALKRQFVIHKEEGLTMSSRTTHGTINHTING